jgi:hypothetical protein
MSEGDRYQVKIDLSFDTWEELVNFLRTNPFSPQPSHTLTSIPIIPKKGIGSGRPRKHPEDWICADCQTVIMGEYHIRNKQRICKTCHGKKRTIPGIDYDLYPLSQPNISEVTNNNGKENPNR